MSDLNEVKTLLLTLAQRVGALETIIKHSHGAPGTPSGTTFGITRVEEPINKLVVLKREKNKCLCGIQTNPSDKQIPVIELNLFNLRAFIIEMETALRTDKARVKLENYSQHCAYAAYKKGEWEMVI